MRKISVFFEIVFRSFFLSRLCEIGISNQLAKIIFGPDFCVWNVFFVFLCVFTQRVKQNAPHGEPEFNVRSRHVVYCI